MKRVGPLFWSIAFAFGVASPALAQSNSVVAWGWNVGGDTNVPSDLTNAVAIDAGYWHSMALVSSGAVRTWGISFLGGVP